MISSSCMQHLVPYASVDAPRHYAADHDLMIQLLRSSYDGLFLSIYSPEIHSPYPLGITLNSFYRMRKVSRVLARAIHAIVTNYFKDERLHKSIMELSADAQYLLDQMAHLPYDIGSWRPDLLFPADTDPERFLICEINARFAFNGYYCSHEKNKILSQLPYLDRIPMMPVTELQDIPDLFRRSFAADQAIGIVKVDAKEGWDVKMFHEHVASTQQNTDSILKPTMTRDDSTSYPSPPFCIREASNEFLHLGHSFSSDTELPLNDIGVRFVHPDQLVIDSKTGFLRDSTGILKQFAIECSQSDILGMKREVLNKLIQNPHINDLRTIFLAHDKRLLSVLSNREIMSAYMRPEEVDILMDSIVPTYVVGVHSDVVSIAKKDRENWLMKPNGGGKGVGIVFGRDCSSDETWADLLDDSAHSKYVLQRVVAQQSAQIQREQGVQEMLVVGIMHCFNDKFLGPGIFRASALDSPIVNVSGRICIIIDTFP